MQKFRFTKIHLELDIDKIDNGTQSASIEIVIIHFHHPNTVQAEAKDGASAKAVSDALATAAGVRIFSNC